MSGLSLDPWQCLVLEQMLATREETYWNEYTFREENRWAAAEFGLVVARQNGKGDQALDSLILTADGWTDFANISVGQEVYGSDGKLVKVVATSEVFTDHDCFRVTFTDGSSYVVGSGHLWVVQDKNSGKIFVKSTQELSETRFAHNRLDNGRNEYRWRVPCNTQIHSSETQLPIDPYLLGYWLGDGYSSQANVVVGDEDLDYVLGKLPLCGVEITSQRRSKKSENGHATALGFSLTGMKGSHTGFLHHLRKLGILNNKRIPEVYLQASKDQRLALLSGLMDSDGSIRNNTKSSQCEFSSSFPDLAKDFMCLARGLGIKTSPKVKKTTHKDAFRFLWTPSFNPFQLPRKSSKFVEPLTKTHETMSVVNIEKTLTVPTRCIQVDAGDGIYLTGRNFTPTHNSILEARELAGLFLFGERKIIHSAHLFDTSREAFKRIKFLIENTPELAKEVLRISNSHGDEGIFLRSGQELLFKARSKSAARGFSADLVVLDEAMMRLGSDEVEAILPTLSARPNGQILYFGSAGTQESEHFGRARNRALKVLAGGEPEPRFGWLEWSAELHSEYCEPNCDLHDSPDDPKTWAKANPAVGFRISIEHIRESEHKSMSPEGFAKERLSVGSWPVEGGGWKVLPKVAWDQRSNELSELKGDFALALDTAPNSSWSCITACGANHEGETHVEVTAPGSEGYDYRPGLQWAVQRVKEIWAAFKPPFVVIDPSSPAGSAIMELEAAGVVVKTVTSREYGQACGDFLNGISPKPGDEAHIRHINQAPLTSSAAAADSIRRQDLWIWDKKESASDITPITSATLAVFAYKSFIYRKSSTPWFSYGD